MDYENPLPQSHPSTGVTGSSRPNEETNKKSQHKIATKITTTTAKKTDNKNSSSQPHPSTSDKGSSRLNEEAAIKSIRNTANNIDYQNPPTQYHPSTGVTGSSRPNEETSKKSQHKIATKITTTTAKKPDNENLSSQPHPSTSDKGSSRLNEEAATKSIRTTANNMDYESPPPQTHPSTGVTGSSRPNEESRRTFTNHNSENNAQPITTTTLETESANEFLYSLSGVLGNSRLQTRSTNQININTNTYNMELQQDITTSTPSEDSLTTGASSNQPAATLQYDSILQWNQNGFWNKYENLRLLIEKWTLTVICCKNKLRSKIL
jgi:hypothetical protein